MPTIDVVDDLVDLAAADVIAPELAVELAAPRGITETDEEYAARYAAALDITDVLITEISLFDAEAPTEDEPRGSLWLTAPGTWAA